MKQGTVRPRREIESEIRKLLVTLKKYEDDLSGWRRQLLLEVIALNAGELVDEPSHTEGELVLIHPSEIPVDVDEYPSAI